MVTPPIVVEERFNAPLSVVWDAITNEAKMPLWFFEPISTFKPEVGFETQFDIEFEGRVYPHQWRVTEVIPKQRIVYDWCYGGFPGASSVRWELSELPKSTLLRLTHTGVESFPQSDPVFSLESCEAGWVHFIQGNLKAFLDGDGSPHLNR